MSVSVFVSVFVLCVYVSTCPCVCVCLCVSASAFVCFAGKCVVECRVWLACPEMCGFGGGALPNSVNIIACLFVCWLFLIRAGDTIRKPAWETKKRYNGKLSSSMEYQGAVWKNQEVRWNARRL